MAKLKQLAKFKSCVNVSQIMWATQLESEAIAKFEELCFRESGHQYDKL